ncbi:MAG: vWA domain-containing protein [Thermomicrobiales bacterium]
MANERTLEGLCYAEVINVDPAAERFMHWLHVAFDRPLFLLVLLLLPVVWLMGRHSLASLGRGRSWSALALRSGLLVLLACALAEIQLVRISERIVALFLLDQSSSVDLEQQRAAFQYVNAVAERQRNPIVGDMAGVIVFGGEAQIEHPATKEELVSLQPETLLDLGHTNIASALRLAKASFPGGASRRVVLLSDGNQNLGDALTQARELVNDGIGIDVAPWCLSRGPMSSWKKLSLRRMLASACRMT